MKISALAFIAMALAHPPAWASGAITIPELSKDPSSDPSADDFSPAVAISLPLPESQRTARAKFALSKGQLIVFLRSSPLAPHEQFRLRFRFVNTTGEGRDLLLSAEGHPAPSPDATVEFGPTRAKNTGREFLTKAWLRAKGMPRFPAKGPLLLEVCAGFHRDSPARGADCGSPITLRIPDSFRSRLALAVTDRVAAVEGRPAGAMGYPMMLLPVWVQGDKPLDARTVRELSTGSDRGSELLEFPFPKRMASPDGKLLVPVLTGRDPNSPDRACDPSRELLLGLYTVKGLNAVRALEWPVATCALGRAVTVVLDQEGDLSIGYSGGPTATFLWSGDHFERTEIGAR